MSTPKQLLVSKRKLFLALISIALICSLASGSIMYVVAQGGSTPITITSGIYPGAPTYTLYEDSGTYYAKNAYGVVTSSASASTILNSAIQALPDIQSYPFYTGGVGSANILLTGTLIFNTPILVDRTCIITGTWARIQFNAGFVVSGDVDGVTFRDLAGKAAAGVTVFAFSGSNNVEFQDIFVAGDLSTTPFASYGIYASANDRANNFWNLQNVVFTNFLYSGIYIAGNGPNSYSTQMVFTNIKTDHCANGVELDHVQDFTFTSLITSDNTNAGILLRGFDIVRIQGFDPERNFNHIQFAKHLTISGLESDWLYVTGIFGVTTGGGIAVNALLNSTEIVKYLIFDNTEWWADQTYFNNTAQIKYITFRNPQFNYGYPTLTNVFHRYEGAGYITSGGYSNVAGGDYNFASRLIATPTSIILSANNATVYPTWKNSTAFGLGIVGGGAVGSFYYQAEYQP